MKEKGLYRAIDKLLPKHIHRQSMTGAAMTANGTPDRYYDGPNGDLWVEYKMLRAMPRSGLVIGEYTPMQLVWMERRYINAKCVVEVYRRTHKMPGTNIVGIVGLPNRTAVIQLTPDAWRKGTPVAKAMPLADVARWIVNFCSQEAP